MTKQTIATTGQPATPHAMSSVLEGLRVKSVRDLCWALESPHLLLGTPDLHVLPDHHAHHLVQQSRAWLVGLDEDPEALQSFLLDRKRKSGHSASPWRLGLYFQMLIEVRPARRRTQ